MFEKKSTYAQFSVAEGGFVHKGVHYSFEDIAHISFALVRTTQRENLIKIGVADSSYLELYLKSGKHLKVSVDEATLWFGFNRNKAQEIDYIGRLYQILSERTFEDRIQQYVGQIEMLGYFAYDDCLFYPAQKSITFRNTAYPLSSYELLRGAGYVLISKKNAGIADKIKRELSFTKLPQFNTMKDTDVIFTLLRHYFGCAWD